jgi:hypothetical protein
MEESATPGAQLLHLPPPDGSEEVSSGGGLSPDHVEEIWQLAYRNVHQLPPDRQPGHRDHDGRDPDARAAAGIAERFGHLPDVRLVAAAERYIRDWLREPEHKRWPRDYVTLTTWGRCVSSSLAKVGPPPDPGVDDDGDFYGDQPDITDAAPAHPDWVRAGLEPAYHPDRDQRRRPATAVLLWLQEHDADTHRAVLSLTAGCLEAEPRKVAAR